ncbi:MAG: gamma-glutamylcyclotransferase [Stellaceae bacterium]
MFETSDSGSGTALARSSAEAMPPMIARLRQSGAPVWIFAYGSLMWNPEVACAEARPALLHGYHRSFCLYSYDYRGTPERPGLALGLDCGGACWGMALRLDGGTLAASLDHLWAREMSGGGVYRMRRLAVRVGDAMLSAWGFVVRRDHSDYAGRLPLDEKTSLIAAARGERGLCRDYLASTLAHLKALGLSDRPLCRLGARVARLAAGPPPPSGLSAAKPAARMPR